MTAPVGGGRWVGPATRPRRRRQVHASLSSCRHDPADVVRPRAHSTSDRMGLGPGLRLDRAVLAGHRAPLRNKPHHSVDPGRRLRSHRHRRPSRSGPGTATTSTGSSTTSWNPGHPLRGSVEVTQHCSSRTDRTAKPVHQFRDRPTTDAHTRGSDSKTWDLQLRVPGIEIFTAGYAGSPPPPRPPDRPGRVRSPGHGTASPDHRRIRRGVGRHPG